MKNIENSEKISQKIALFRYELIIPALNNTFPDKSAFQYFIRIASQPVKYIDGTEITISQQTIRAWYYSYKKHGFDGLIPKTRSDKGISRNLSNDVKNKIRKLKEENRRMTGTSIYLKLIEEGDIYKNDVSLSTVNRYLAAIRPTLGINIVEDMRAFEMEHSNELWQLDTTYCSYIEVDGKKTRTYLIMIVDDHSRMIVGYGFFLEDNGINVQKVLKKAILKYGVPKRIFTDNGKPYVNEQLKLICAQLQIDISRAQVFHGNQKGKVERAFKSVKEQWMYNTDFSKFRNVDDITADFSEYVNKKNNSEHKSLKDTPLNTFMEDAELIRRCDKEIVERAFYHTVKRNVYNDGTIKISNRQFETSQKYIGCKVTIKYIPDLSHVYIYEDDSYIEIKEVDKVANSKIKRNKPLYAEEEK